MTNKNYIELPMPIKEFLDYYKEFNNDDYTLSSSVSGDIDKVINDLKKDLDQIRKTDCGFLSTHQVEVAQKGMRRTISSLKKSYKLLTGREHGK